MRSGRLRHRVTLQTLSESADSFGQKVQTYTAAGTFWANVVPLAGREAEIAHQARAETTHKVTLRYQGSTAIPATARFLFKGRFLNITEVTQTDERLREIVCKCTEVLTP